MAGQNPGMVIRVAATIAELRANLKEGVSQIETTTAAMHKLAASFSGDKLIQAAHNVTAAVAQIGGASNLTEREQARVNATLEKALEKYRVLGKEAPAGMQKLADETKQVDASSFKLTDTVKQLALGFAAMFTARAAFNFVKSTIDEASALKDLSQQTHINVEELQLLAGAMSEFGVDADMLGKGLFNLSRRIAKGDDSVADALLQMGISLREVRGLEGEELFLTIERGLARLHGSLRDTTASDLFGSRLGMAMAGASEGIDGAMESARRLNTVMSEESVDALDRYDEAIKRAQRSLSGLAANMIGPVAEGFNVITDAAGKGASKWDIFVAMTKDWAASNSVTGASTAHLAKLLDGLNRKTDDAAVKTAAATAAHREHVPALESTAGATKKAREETEALEKAVLKEAEAYAKLMSEVANAEGLAQMDEASATMQRAAENAEGIWIMERDAWQMAHASRQQALAEEEALVAKIEASLAGLTIIGQTPPKPSGNFMFGDRPPSGGSGYQVPKFGTPAPPSSLAQTGVVVFDGGVPGLAHGGPVSAGQPYIVGERGAELFVPSAAGAIVPSGSGGSTITIAAGAVQINYPLMNDPRARMEIAAMVGDALMVRLRQQGLRVPSGA